MGRETGRETASETLSVVGGQVLRSGATTGNGDFE
jgi:hypothetical protein